MKISLLFVPPATLAIGRYPRHTHVGDGNFGVDEIIEEKNY